MTEFTKVIAVSEIPPQGRTMHFESTVEERIAIAARAKIPDVDSFAIELQLQFLPQSHILEIKGFGRAKITQVCVVTLEPFEAELNFDFDCQCLESERAKKWNNEMDSVEDYAQGGFEEVIDGKVDIGEIAVQEFILALDPYPHKPGARADLDAANQASGEDNPFSVLKSLKKQ
ncbi:MAG: DUF177 domain-containing protein [Alphaproteobacteria bacterium]|nr:MAG: DUF177 domain-containing protein [Alphaproteobacteria bacterium]